MVEDADIGVRPKAEGHLVTNSSPNAWKVPTHISIAASAFIADRRSRISSAALFEKVSARIEAGETPCPEDGRPVHQRLRLAGARTGIDEQWTIPSRCGRPLALVKAELWHGCVRARRRSGGKQQGGDELVHDQIRRQSQLGGEFVWPLADGQ